MGVGLDSVVLSVLSSTTDSGIWGVLTRGGAVFGAKRGRKCMDSGGDDDAIVLFSAALTGTIMIGTLGAIGEDDPLGALFPMIVGDIVSMPGGRLESSLDFGVGIAIYK